MKPLKGMNTDVSADNQSEGTYRKAVNWVYGKELDALLQEAGTRAAGVFADRHFIGGHSFETGDMVLFSVDSNSATAGSQLDLYTASTEVFSTLIHDDALGFNREYVYDVVSFRNEKDERIIIYTDGNTPPRTLNVDDPEVNMRLNKVFPDYTYPEMALEGITSGNLEAGSHFIATAYELEDGTQTKYGNLMGPYRLKDDGKGLQIAFTSIDTDYANLLVAVLSVFDDTVDVNIVGKYGISSSSFTTAVTKSASLGELLLEDITILPVVYITAGTTEFHSNRLHLGNVSSQVDPELQSLANKIEPTWKVAAAGEAGNAQISEEEYPHGQKYMPDEVYAFYVAWIRDDGTYTKAYHIPGRPVPTAFDVAIDYDAVTAVATGGVSTVSINLTETIDTMLDHTDSGEVNDNGELNFLKLDRAILKSTDAGYSDMRYWQTRCTANVTFQAGEGDTHFKGQMGIWENKNEAYPSDFPTGNSYVWNGAGTSATQTSGLTLASAKVRHHRMPSISWLKGNCTGFNWDLISDRGIQVDFDFIEIPDGYQGVRFYHAQRDPTNSIILGTAGLHFGAANLYSVYGNGGTEYAGYATKGCINAHSSNNNDLSTNHPDAYTAIEEINGIDFTTANTELFVGGSGIDPESYEQVFCSKGVIHPMGMLSLKTNLPPRAYAKFETLVARQEMYPGNYSDSTSAVTISHSFMDLDSASSDWYSTLVWDDNRDHAARRMVFDMTDNVNTSAWSVPYQSEILAIKESRYIAPHLLDAKVKFDNRWGEESLYIDFDLSVSYADGGYDVDGEYKVGGNGLHTYEWLYLSSEIQALIPNVFTDSYHYDKSRYTILNGLRCVQRLPIINYCTYREDCYATYTTQTLVACDIGPSLGVSSSMASHRRVDSSFGDVVPSTIRYRITSSAGGDQRYLSAVTREDIEDFGTESYQRGVVAAEHKVFMYSPVDFDLRSKLDPNLDLGEVEYLMRDASPEETNNFELETDYQRLNIFQQPLVSGFSDNEIYDFPYRIARSQAQPSDAHKLFFRNFPPIDYYEQPKDKGKIINLASLQEKLIIHHERSIYLTAGNEQILTSAGQVVLGTGDIFQTPPQELTTSEYGYGGTQHLLSCVTTPMGYFWVDQSRREAFMLKEGISAISALGMRDEFKSLLDLNTELGNTIAAHSYYPGIIAEYDPEFNRVVLMIRNGGTGTSTAPVFPLSHTDYFAETTQNADDYIDDSKYLSFSLDNNAWLSYHEYRADYFLGSSTKLWAIGSHDDDLRIYEHNVYTDSGTALNSYHGQVRVASTIDLSFPAGQTAVYSSFNWLTKTKDLAGTNQGYIDHNATFESAIVYNDYQCSGTVSLSTLIRQTGTRWQFNEFRDLVADRADAFMTLDLEVIDSNIDATKPWYSQKRIGGSHAVLRLITSITGSNPLYLYDIDAAVRKAFR